MAKAKFMIAAILLLSSPQLHAQLVVAAPVLETLFTATKLDQAVYYGQMIQQTIQSATNAYNQLQTAVRMYEMSRNNLSRIAEVRSWDDFMTWYNRQLELERRTERQISQTNVKIGNNTHGIRDIMDIPASIREGFADHWDREFTPRQRREMWLNLGLTPSNYAYVLTWGGRHDKLVERFATRAEIENEVGGETTAHVAGHLHAANVARATAGDDWTGEQELLSILVEMTGMQIDALLRMNMTLAELMEMQAVKSLLDQTERDAPPLSPHWNDDPFTPLTNHGNRVWTE